MYENLKKATERQREMREKGELVVSHNPAQKIANLIANGGKVSALQALKAKCWECMGGSAHEWDASIRNDIRNCSSGPQSSSPCPLYDFRPYRVKKNAP